MEASVALVVAALVVGGCGARPSDSSARPDHEVPGAVGPEWRSGDEPGRGRPAPSQVTPEPPVELVLPDGTRMRVVPVSTGRDGALGLPSDVGTAGWWSGGPRLGDPFGALTLAAHVDSFDQGIGPFVRLLTMRPGQRVRLISHTLSREFTVDDTRFVPRSALSADPDAFVRDGPLRLVLITCGGPYDADAGGYRDNVVVVAGASSPPR